MPLPTDLAPGRAAELVEELGRVVVVSPAGVAYAVRTDSRHVVRHAVLGAVVGFWLGRLLGAAVPAPLALALAPLCLVLGAAAWALRFPPGARCWVQAERFGAEDELGGAVAWTGVRDAAALPAAVDDVVALVRAGRLDALPEHDGPDRIRLRWGSRRST
ncbi:hypothetical protein [Arthrobacter sp. NEB 688]|uniref:hypothetical protein n=1 Tax=Arthrobacter sp. NEB 688 TaxID=904039 RepID=UPI001565BDD7|nr:hypothetical protein [Arthrobacter sp. NEB 688]QKE85348.1 hypothetical protein HL663_16310 [Arthrobacter sp. NEB 688]